MTETMKFTPSFRANRWLEIDNATFHAGDAIDIELSEATVDQLFPLGVIEIIVRDDADIHADDAEMAAPAVAKPAVKPKAPRRNAAKPAAPDPAAQA